VAGAESKSDKVVEVSSSRICEGEGHRGGHLRELLTGEDVTPLLGVGIEEPASGLSFRSGSLEGTSCIPCTR